MYSFQALAFTAGLLVFTKAACGQTFSAGAAVGLEADELAQVDPGAENVDAEEVSGGDGRGPAADVQTQDLITVGPFIRTCPCTKVKTQDLVVDDIRAISDKFSADGNAKSAAGLSNMVWGFGQFLDHDLTLTIDDEDSPTIELETELDVMEVHRAVTTRRRGCKNNLNVHTPTIDGGPIYGSDPAFLRGTLRDPGTCRLRSPDGDFMPVTTAADSNGNFRFVAGDVRVSEHAFLTAQHIVWLREHNRLCEVVNATPRYDGMSVNQKFELVRNVVVAKFQQVVLTEFLPALGISQGDVENAAPLTTQRGVSVEFSIAFRLGHDLIGNDVGGLQVAEAFDAERFFLDFSGTDAAPSVTYKANANTLVSNIMLQLSTTAANEIDGKLSDALRNLLFGSDQGADLAGLNIFRGRDLGVATYAGLARCYGTTPNARIEAETPDAWLGLLREPKAPGEALPPTVRAIITEQFHRSFFSRHGHYWRTFLRKVGGFVAEIERTTYADIISLNTGARVTGNVFKTTSG